MHCFTSVGSNRLQQLCAQQGPASLGVQRVLTVCVCVHPVLRFFAMHCVSGTAPYTSHSCLSWLASHVARVQPPVRDGVSSPLPICAATAWQPHVAPLVLRKSKCATAVPLQRPSWGHHIIAGTQHNPQLPQCMPSPCLMRVLLAFRECMRHAKARSGASQLQRGCIHMHAHVHVHPAARHVCAQPQGVLCALPPATPPSAPKHRSLGPCLLRSRQSKQNAAAHRES
jgi:hypothetical protein